MGSTTARVVGLIVGFGGLAFIAVVTYVTTASALRTSSMEWVLPVGLGAWVVGAALVGWSARRLAAWIGPAMILLGGSSMLAAQAGYVDRDWSAFFHGGMLGVLVGVGAWVGSWAMWHRRQSPV